jgi:DNA invertase Pin-like site-specific DNA recombinase
MGSVMQDTHSQQFVSYVRVSTERQGKSGLGLDAQRAAVTTYIAGLQGRLLQEFREIESGKKDERPQLAAALAACRKHKAVLVIAKLDRLARRVSFISALMDGDVDFVACDFPQANRLTLHILAAVAEHEREMISQRTRAALQAARTRGVRLGNPTNANVCLERARAARSAKARRWAENVRPVIDQIMRSGANSLRVIGAALMARGVTTARGNTRWHPEQVAAVLKITDARAGSLLAAPRTMPVGCRPSASIGG